MSIKFFEDRVVQHPGRVKLTPIEGQSNVFDVERVEGEIYKAGTLLNSSNLTLICNALTDLDANSITVNRNASNEIENVILNKNDDNKKIEVTRDSQGLTTSVFIIQTINSVTLKRKLIVNRENGIITGIDIEEVN